jgi:hypothetical protein
MKKIWIEDKNNEFRRGTIEKTKSGFLIVHPFKDRSNGYGAKEDGTIIDNFYLYWWQSPL